MFQAALRRSEMFKRPLVALAVIVALAFVGERAHANDQSDLDKGRAAYLGRQYDEAETRFRGILDPKSRQPHDPAFITQARMYLGAVKVAEHKKDEASALFEKLLLTDPGFDPDPLSFPTEVIDLFIDTRARMRDAINAAAQAAVRAEAVRKAREEEERRKERARLVALEKLAGEESVIERHSRLVAFVPFGAGQFQNGQKELGWLFLGSEALAVAVGAATVPIYLGYLQKRSDAARAGENDVAGQYVDRASTVRDVNLAAFGAFAALAVTGIVHANVTFVPTTTEVRKRALPPHPEITPTVQPVTQGLVLGMSGRF